MTWLGAAFGEWRRSLLAGDAVGCWKGSNVMCGGPPAWVHFGRGGKVPVRERGWKFSLVLWTAVNSCRACYTCRGLMQRAETRRKRVWQDPMVLLYQWGLGQQTHFTSRCPWRPKQITSTYRGHRVWFLHCFWGSQLHFVFTLGTWKLPILAPSPLANQVQNAGRRSRGGCSFTANGLQPQRQLI